MAAGYAGDILPRKAWSMLADDPRAALIDVRTTAEWSFVGVPDLASIGKETLYVPWVEFPAMAQNPHFAAEIERMVPDHDAPLVFICRSGARSRSAAIEMTKRGYHNCYNIATGFEGDPDPSRHRNSTGGWRFDQLPWIQT
ncbi:MAG: rhodanese-like domain-containing protein [Rhodospirillales bacterium]|nr:rhodanese-like domain-containing protein [Rhodospirillales bacterium]